MARGLSRPFDERTQSTAYLRPALIAFFGISLAHPQDNRLELFGHVRLHFPGRLHGILGRGLNQLEVRCARFDQTLTGRQLPKYDPERVLIGTPVDLLAQELLRGHIGELTLDLAGECS